MVKLYLIWEEKTDPSGVKRVRVFPSIDILNDFLSTLNSDNISSVEVVAGLQLENRVE